MFQKIDFHKMFHTNFGYNCKLIDDLCQLIKFREHIVNYIAGLIVFTNKKLKCDE